MADLMKIAKEYRNEIMDGIAWVAVWKKGRSWNAKVFWLDKTEKIEDCDMKSARDIIAEDPGAVLINEYYCAHMGEGTLADIAAGIRFHYDNGYNRLAESTAYRNSVERYRIYRLKDTPELNRFRFAGISELPGNGMTDERYDVIRPENYELVYEGNLDGIGGEGHESVLEAIYAKFNIAHPADFRGYSLSVSDIVVLYEALTVSAYFVDTVGFTEIPEFVRRPEEKEAERNDSDVR